MESSVIKNTSLPGLRPPTPLLRLAPDERLIALVRRGHQGAFEVIVARYQARLLAFCRHMLASREDAEDVLQEVFAAAFNAILADSREINVRPWLYRIARNRCLNHLRRQTAIGVDSMDVHFADAGQSTVEKAAGREDFRLLMSDIRRLPETQRTALLLREMDALSYEQIAEAMETTIPGVKSLLVRARVSLGEAAEARKLTCAEVRLELGGIAEGISRATPPVRRHVKDCQRCRDFRSALKANNRVLAAALPVGPLLLLKKVALTKLGLSAGAGGAGGGGAAAGAATAAGGAAALGTSGAAGGGFAGALTAGTLGAKAVAGLAAAALVTAGAAVEVRHAPPHHRPAAAVARVVPPREIVPAVAASAPQPTTTVRLGAAAPIVRDRATVAVHAAAPAPVVPGTAAPAVPAAAVVPVAPAAAPAPAPAPTVQQITDSSVLPPQPAAAAGPAGGPAAPTPVQVITQSVGPPPPVVSAPPPPVAAPAAGSQAATDTIVSSTVPGGDDARVVAGGAVGPGTASTSAP